MHRKKYTALAVACLITLVFAAHAAAASSRCDITFINNLSEPITAVKILYDTPYDEPRPSSSEILLPPGGEYRLGIQGVTLPTRIILYLPLASYEFTNLSGLAPDSAMRLETAYEDGIPSLKREDDAAKSVTGAEQKYLTPKNRPYAVDRDFLTDCKIMGEVRELVTETAEDAEPAAPNLDDILFTEVFDGRSILYFPVFWTDDFAGYASATPADPDNPGAGLVIAVSVPLPEDEAADAADKLMSDLRVDGYRPVQFNLRARGEDDKEVNFLEGDGDKYDDQEVVQEHLAAALEKGTLLEAEVLWAKEDAFEKAKADEESPEGPAVRVRVANGQFEALFMP